MCNRPPSPFKTPIHSLTLYHKGYHSAHALQTAFINSKLEASRHHGPVCHQINNLGVKEHMYYTRAETKLLVVFTVQTHDIQFPIKADSPCCISVYKI